MTKKTICILSGFASILALAALLAGCGAVAATVTPTSLPPPLEVDLILDPDITEVLAGQTVALNLVASGQGLQFKWSVARGSLSAFDAPSVIYTAPSTPGLDTVSVEVTSAATTTTKSVNFNVTVPPTESPVPTIAPTATPAPLPLAEIFPQSADGKEFTFMNENGTITPEFLSDEDCIHSGIYGIRITYDMQGQSSGGWGVHWINPPALTHFDASEFGTLTFWVKGLAGSERFQLSMKDTNNREFWIESREILVVKKSWTPVSVPLQKFAGVNTSSVENLAFGFNFTHGAGSICIDEITFAP